MTACATWKRGGQWGQCRGGGPWREPVHLPEPPSGSFWSSRRPGSLWPLVCTSSAFFCQGSLDPQILVSEPFATTSDAWPPPLILSPALKGRGDFPIRVGALARAEGDFCRFLPEARPRPALDLHPLPCPRPPSRLCAGHSPPKSRLPREADSRLLPRCSVIAIKCDSPSCPPGSCRCRFIYEPGFRVSGGDCCLHIPIFLEPRLRRKGCLDFPYTHVLCVNKCLQFYIEDGINVRAANCIFFTFIDFKTMILYISVFGEL